MAYLQNLTQRPPANMRALIRGRRHFWFLRVLGRKLRLDERLRCARSAEIGKELFKVGFDNHDLVAILVKIRDAPPVDVTAHRGSGHAQPFRRLFGGDGGAVVCRCGHGDSPVLFALFGKFGRVALFCP